MSKMTAVEFGEVVAGLKIQLAERDETIAELHSSLSNAEGQIQQLRKELAFTKKAMAAAAKKELVESFKAAALRNVRDREAKEKTGFLEKQLLDKERENRILHSKVRVLNTSAGGCLQCNGVFIGVRRRENTTGVRGAD
jgi:chromosome segregation ATPase